MRYDFDSGLLTGRIEGEAADLSAWSDLAGGTLAGRLSLTADLRPKETQQDASITAKTVDFGFDDLRLASGDVVIEVSDLLGDFSGTAKINAKNIDLDGQQIASLDLTARGSLEAADFDLKLAGELYGPFDLATLGRLEEGAQGTTLTLSKLDGTAIGYPFSTNGPVVFKQGPGALWHPGQIHAGGPRRNFEAFQCRP